MIWQNTRNIVYIKENIMIKVRLINYKTNKVVFEYENPPQYLPREGEFINVCFKGLFKVLRVVHENYICTVINIYVESCK